MTPKTQPSHTSRQPTQPRTANYAGVWQSIAPTPVMMVGGATIYAGSARLVAHEIERLDLMIDLAGIVMGRGSLSVVTGNATARSRLPDSLFTDEVPLIAVDWPDASIPALDTQWWADLVKYIETLPWGSRVGIGCMGGIGRTGTALSIIGALSGTCGPESDPVTWLRSVYDKDAVETYTQLRYVERVTGRNVMADPSDLFRHWDYGKYADRWDDDHGNPRGEYLDNLGASVIDPDDENLPLPASVSELFPDADGWDANAGAGAGGSETLPTRDTLG